MAKFIVSYEDLANFLSDNTHEWDDICVNGCKIGRIEHGVPRSVVLGITPEYDGEPIDNITLTAEDVAEIASWLGLVVYPENSAIGVKETAQRRLSDGTL